MENRRVFRRAHCKIPVVVRCGGQFLYGEVINPGLGGVRLTVKGKLEKLTLTVEISPRKQGATPVIPLPYTVRWHLKGSSTVGLKFSGGTDAFFRSWIAEHVYAGLVNEEALLDKRKSVRASCEVEGMVRRESGESYPAAIVNLSIGGLRFVTPEEVYPGETFDLRLPFLRELGKLEIIVLRSEVVGTHHLCAAKFLEPGLEQVERIGSIVRGLIKVSPRGS